ncbi:hypothetical protein B0H19DRAFT_1255427 [Mycena capillaripes]|nr:hypothetical protein B0H19DRAFT_1255427 [Mycena capillaripes]
MRAVAAHPAPANGLDIDDDASHKRRAISSVAFSPRISQPQTPPPDPNPASLLPLDLVHQLQIASYVLIWDILHGLAADYRILAKHQLRISFFAYLVSRVSSLVYVLGFTLFATYPIPDCQVARLVFDSFFPVSAGASSLLFFFRVCAVYENRRLIALIFGFLWISVVGTGVLVPIGSEAATLGSACIVTKLHPYITASTICLAVNDTGVFFAISYRLLRSSNIEYTPGQRIQVLFSGATLHAFSKALFLDGQKYYMITIFANLAMILIVFSPGIPPILPRRDVDSEHCTHQHPGVSGVPQHQASLRTDSAHVPAYDPRFEHREVSEICRPA